MPAGLVQAVKALSARAAVPAPAVLAFNEPNSGSNGPAAIAWVESVDTTMASACFHGIEPILGAVLRR